MKKILILCAFVMSAGLASAQAKTCAKKCTAAEKAACAKTAASADATTTMSANVLAASAAADIAAQSDESISRKECPLSGKVSYFQKSQCEKSGKISMNEVTYDAEAQAFVNASPSEVMSDQEAKVIKTADTVDGKVQTTETAGKKKACCKGKKQCSSKKAGA